MDQDDVRAVQQAINISHPFGLKVWKPALYSKQRSIDLQSSKLLHQEPGLKSHFYIGKPEFHLDLFLGNLIWTLLCGWWLGLAYSLIQTWLFMLGI